MSIQRFRPTIAMRANARLRVWLPALALLAAVGLYAPLASMLVHVVSPAETIAGAAPTITTASAASTTTQAAAQVVAKPAVKTPGCVPLSFGMPGQLGLSSTPGLQTQIDTPTYYQIYGNTAAQLRSQIQHCAPGANGNSSAEFTAQTSYSLTWQYDIAMGASCSLNDVRVGLHTAMALPSWQPTGSEAAGLTGRWQTFIRSLTTHEQGHETIDKQYAAVLATDLSAISNVGCNNLNTVVNSVVQRDVATLNQTNDSYDTQTNHGATQGAILPTY